jgi:hypothetical protein
MEHEKLSVGWWRNELAVCKDKDPDEDKRDQLNQLAEVFDT